MVKFGPLLSFAVISFLTATWTTQASANIYRSIQADLKSRKSTSFNALLDQWEKKYSVKAVPTLFKIAAQKNRPDPDRYVALMGAAKLGGNPAAPLLVSFLKDQSWMLRTAALRALSALDNSETKSRVLPLLKDRALVVRLEAVEAIRKLRPSGSVEALSSALSNPANYHHGKATWVPQRALAALVELDAKSVVPQLAPLLDHRTDPDLQFRTIATLEALTGKNVAADRPIAEKIKEWKKILRNTI